MFAISCYENVEPGEVGVKVYLLGGDKGISNETIGVGWYFIPPTQKVYKFPTSQQNHVWTMDKTEGSPTDESITFQSKDGVAINVDAGVSFCVNPHKVSELFQKYRKGMTDITHIYIRSLIRDVVTSEASNYTIEEIYGEKRNTFVKSVEHDVRERLEPIGITIDSIFFVGKLRLPQTIIDAIDAKMVAAQRAIQRQNEVAEEQSAALKRVAAAQGEADSIEKIAAAQAKANDLIRKSITPELIQYELMKRWDGKLPMYSGGGVPLISLPGMK